MNVSNTVYTLTISFCLFLFWKCGTQMTLIRIDLR